jgi:hypothetical protein
MAEQEVVELHAQAAADTLLALVCAPLERSGGGAVARGGGGGGGERSSSRRPWCCTLALERRCPGGGWKGVCCADGGRRRSLLTLPLLAYYSGLGHALVVLGMSNITQGWRDCLDLSRLKLYGKDISCMNPGPGHWCCDSLLLLPGKRQRSETNFDIEVTSSISKLHLQYRNN